MLPAASLSGVAVCPARATFIGATDANGGLIGVGLLHRVSVPCCRRRRAPGRSAARTASGRVRASERCPTPWSLHVPLPVVVVEHAAVARSVLPFAPPATSTLLPSGPSATAACEWRCRNAARGRRARRRVADLVRRVRDVAAARLPARPPTTSTLPFGSKVAVWCSRAVSSTGPLAKRAAARRVVHDRRVERVARVVGAADDQHPAVGQQRRRVATTGSTTGRRRTADDHVLVRRDRTAGRSSCRRRSTITLPLTQQRRGVVRRLCSAGLPVATNVRVTGL